MLFVCYFFYLQSLSLFSDFFFHLITDFSDPASGSSADWTYGVAKIKYSFGLELRDTGEYGFLLPATQIQPSGEEMFAAMKVLGHHILNNDT